MKTQGGGQLKAPVHAYVSSPPPAYKLPSSHKREPPAHTCMCLHQPTFALIRLLGSRRVDFLEPVGAGAPGELGVGGGGALVRGTGPGVRNRGARYESRDEGSGSR